MLYIGYYSSFITNENYKEVTIFGNVKQKGKQQMMFLDALTDTLIDGIKILPFLFLTYVLMEYIEHKAGGKAARFVRKSGKMGPVVGSILGVVPQCGFSAAAANFYAGRIITLGTLISIFLSTSDEMLPILISEQVSPVLIFEILGMKIVIGMIAGFLIDLILHRKGHEDEEMRIDHMCDHEHCHCDQSGILKSALIHTLQIFAFIVLISFALNILIGIVGEDKLGSFMTSIPAIGILLSGLIGLIPNCAASVVITQLYLEGLLSMGSMMAGLLVGSGIGLLVLFRVNEDLKENLKITAILYGIGIVCGFLIDLVM